MSRPRQSIIWEMPKGEFENLVKNSTSIGQILKAFGLKNKGGNSNTVKRRIKHEHIDMSHITLGLGSNKGKKFPPKTPNHQMFIEHSTSPRHRVKERITKEELIPYRCRDCGLGNSWNGKTLVLQLEHINGIPDDNRLENLAFLCPNCHTQTPTYAGKRFKKSKNFGSLGTIQE